METMIDNIQDELRPAYVNLMDEISAAIKKEWQKTDSAKQIRDLEEKVRELEFRNKLLFDAVVELKTVSIDAKLKTNIRLSRADFIKLYNRELDKLDDDPDNSAVYGNDVCVHWNGFYCNCSDGATAWNHIICGVESVIDEIGEDE